MRLRSLARHFSRKPTFSVPAGGRHPVTGRKNVNFVPAGSRNRGTGRKNVNSVPAGVNRFRIAGLCAIFVAGTAAAEWLNPADGQL